MPEKADLPGYEQLYALGYCPGAAFAVFRIEESNRKKIALIIGRPSGQLL